MNDLALRETGQLITRNSWDIPEPVVPRSFHQLGVFINDGSGSMTHPALNGMEKRMCVGMATAEVFMRFQGSTKRNNFSFAVVDFDDEAERRLEITSAGDLDPYQDYIPASPGKGGTAIAVGLEHAERLVHSFLNRIEDVARSVVIIVLSDGMDGTPSETLQIAERLKEIGNVTICTCFLAERGRYAHSSVRRTRCLRYD